MFFSLMIVALSFLPVFTLEAQEGRMFAPLAYTKTYAMVAASLLSITLVPVLIWYLVRGRIRPENANPVNRAAAAAYRPFLALALRHPWAVTVGATLFVLATLWPASRLGSEFMPELDEGDLLYMPTTLPGLSTDAARSLLQQTDRLIKTVPEVESVFGKAGRAETASDPAPESSVPHRLLPLCGTICDQISWTRNVTVEGSDRLPVLSTAMSVIVFSPNRVVYKTARSPVVAWSKTPFR